MKVTGMNTGFLKFGTDIEMGDEGVFNTTGSRLWQRVVLLFQAELKEQYSLMRQDRFTVDNIMKYLYGEQISQIPATYYNKDMQTKYLNFGSSYLYALHGSGEQHIKKWIRERIMYVDTLLGYMTSSSDYITLRSSKLGEVYLDIQTYIPMYVSVKWRDEANNTGLQTKRVGRGETVRFTYNMPTATDQEILVYAGYYLKSLGNVSNLQPTSMLIANASRLTEIECHSPNLINTDLSECKLLQKIDLSDCTALGTGIGAQPILNIQGCNYLRKCDCRNTQLTAIYTMQAGGNLEEIYYPDTIQSIQLTNQTYLHTVGIPYGYDNLLLGEEWSYGDSINEVNMKNFIPVIFNTSYTFDNTHDAGVINIVEYNDYYEEMKTTVIDTTKGENKFTTGNYTKYLKISFNGWNGWNGDDSGYGVKEIRLTPTEYLNINRQCRSLANVEITNCSNIKHIHYPYTADEGIVFEPMKYVQNLTLTNSLIGLTSMSFNGFNKLKSISLGSLHNLKFLGFDDMMTIADTASLESFKISDCPLITEVTFNVSDANHKIEFMPGTVIDLGAMQSVHTIQSNASIKGLETIILPTTLKTLDFVCEYGDKRTDIKNLWSCTVNHNTDGFEGMDLQDITLDLLDMSGLTNVMKAKNFYLAPTVYHPNMNTMRDGELLPYFIPEGRIDLSGYTGSMIAMLKGIDLSKLEVIINGRRSHTDLTSLFEGAILQKTDKFNMVDKVNEILSHYPYSINWTNLFYGADVCFDTVDIDIPDDGSGRTMNLSGMFRATSVKTDIKISNNIENVSDMFRNCVNMVEYLENWNEDYPNGLVPDRCYFGTGGDLDFVPADWGGYGFYPNVVTEIEINVPTDNYEFILISPENMLSRGVVKWGDSMVDFIGENGNYGHTYKKSGVYTVKGHFTFGNNVQPTTSMQQVLTAVNYMATDSTDLSQAFNGCNNLTRACLDGLNVTSLLETFRNCTLVTDIDLSACDTSKVTSMRETFYNCTSLVRLDIDGLKTDNVESMYGMFYGCEVLPSLNLSSFNTKKVNAMQYMFYNCKLLKSIDVSGFDTSNVNNMAYMFYNCAAITELNLTNFITEKVTDMAYMFGRCGLLTSLDLKSFDTSNVTSMLDMFYSCTSLMTLDVSNFNTKKVTDMSSMFNRCTVLESLDLSNFNGDELIDGQYIFSGCNNLTSLKLDNFNTPKLEDMRYMFSGCMSLTELDLSAMITGNVTTMYSLFINCSKLRSINLTGWKTGNVTNMQYMFNGCSALESVDVSGFDTSKVTTMHSMFINCNALKTLDVSGWDTSNVTTMYDMFYGCGSLATIDVSNFKTNKVNTMYGMFYNCGSVEVLDVSGFETDRVDNMQYMFYGCNSVLELDVSNFNTSNVITMQGMFYGCKNVKVLDLSKWDTKNVAMMQNMFQGCSSVLELNLSSFITNKLNRIQYMFYGCTSLQKLDLRNFNTSSIIDMQYLFYDCSALKELYLTDWNTKNVSEMQYMFYNCKSLSELDLTSFNTSNVTNMEGMFENCNFNVNFNGKSTSKVISAGSMFKNFGGTSIDMTGCKLSSSVNNNDFLFNAANLEDFIPPIDIRVNINIRSNKLTVNTLLLIIDALAEVDSTQTLDIGSVNLAKLTDEQILVAIDKNWSIC